MALVKNSAKSDLCHSRCCSYESTAGFTTSGVTSGSMLSSLGNGTAAGQSMLVGGLQLRVKRLAEIPVVVGQSIVQRSHEAVCDLAIHGARAHFFSCLLHREDEVNR